jgi:diacylglycerol kinase family enzyme
VRETIHVIATTVSGSIVDWGKVKRIIPLFAEHGRTDVMLHTVDSHADAKRIAEGVLNRGARILISAGGSGTFNAVLEGCLQSDVPLNEIRLGFLRKGSADLIGKVLKMPDEIEAAITVFAEALRTGCTTPCDILQAEDGSDQAVSRRFVGYGGAEIFGRIPHFTENRFMKWYKGILSQVLGDLGPFTTGMFLALIEKLLTTPLRGSRHWKIHVDGQLRSEGRYQALIVVNGYLGPDLPYSSDPLGSRRFQLFALRDQGTRRLISQAKQARSGKIVQDPEKWGLERYDVSELLRLECDGKRFPANVDGSTLRCRDSLLVRRIGSIELIARPKE